MTEPNPVPAPNRALFLAFQATLGANDAELVDAFTPLIGHPLSGEAHVLARYLSNPKAVTDEALYDVASTLAAHAEARGGAAVPQAGLLTAVDALRAHAVQTISPGEVVDGPPPGMPSDIRGMLAALVSAGQPGEGVTPTHVLLAMRVALAARLGLFRAPRRLVGLIDDSCAARGARFPEDFARKLRTLQAYPLPAHDGLSVDGMGSIRGVANRLNGTPTLPGMVDIAQILAAGVLRCSESLATGLSNPLALLQAVQGGGVGVDLSALDSARAEANQRINALLSGRCFSNLVAAGDYLALLEEVLLDSQTLHYAGRPSHEALLRDTGVRIVAGVRERESEGNIMNLVWMTFTGQPDNMTAQGWLTALTKQATNIEWSIFDHETATRSV